MDRQALGNAHSASHHAGRLILGGRKTRTAWIALPAVFLLALQAAAFAQSPPAQPTQCLGESDAVSVAATALPPQVLFEVEITLQNKTANRIHVDPAQFTMLTDQQEQSAPLTAEVAKSIIRNPGQSMWSFIWFGYLGYATNQAKQEELMKHVDATILTPGDVAPNAGQKGSLYFRPPNPKTDEFTLVADGLTAESGALPPIRLTCEFPKSRAGQAPPSVRTYSLLVRSGSGPVTITLSRVQFTKDFTSLEATIENTSDVEADLFFAKAATALTDGRGRSYALRSLRTEIADRVAAHSSVHGLLIFEPAPLPPLTTSLTLAMPDIHVGDEVYEVKVDLHI